MVSAVADQMIEELTAQRARLLEPFYAVVFLDAQRVRIRDEGLVRN